jgi:hypothetical protein
VPAPLAPAKLEAIEAKLGSALPDSLRSFVLEVANGGPGPECTLWPLATGVKQLAAPGDASRRFPLSSKRIAELVTEKQTDDEVVHYDEEAPLPLHGVVPIADAGCDLMFAVVTRGKSAGRVWLVGEAWSPLLDEAGASIRFDHWIGAWLARIDPESDPRPEPTARTPSKKRPAKARSRPSDDSAIAIDPTWPLSLRRALTKADSTTSLSLSTNDWSEDFGAVLPDVFHRLPNLKSLSISDNYALARLPPSIGRLGRLQKLWLTSNRQLRAIDVVGELRSLELLNIARSNSIPSLPDSVGRLPKLRRLIASFSKLKTLPESFAEASQLAEVALDLSFDLDMRRAWPVLASMPALTTLRLDESRLRTWPEKLSAPPALREISLVRAELPAGQLGRLKRALPGVTITA